jgi:uncharacterized heparinase superfamily protein
MTLWRDLVRRWQFARHIPPRQIAARALRTARRKWETRFPQQRSGSGARFVHQPPLPVFAPREVAVEQTSTGWRFGFLGREVAMAGDIDWRLPADDPATQLWRMNLHYMEWLEALDAETGLAAIRSWIAANPPYTRESWSDSWNSYTLSLRVVCWMQFVARHRIADAYDVAQSLCEQLDVLTRHLETDIGGNHLIKNIKAVIWGAAALDCPQAGEWRDTGRALLDAELKRQILPDGMHYELSPSYHAQVFADLLECHHALGSRSPLATALAKMASAAAMLQHPDGGPAQFNDAGLTMCYTPGECLAVYERLTGKAAVPVTALPDAGYYRFETPHFSLIADGGRIGPDDLPAHAHGDIGNFELSAGQHRMIVDQGVFEYVDGPKRRLSRSTAAHNTICVGDRDQADFFGAFRCGARPAQVDAKTDADSLTLRWQVAHDLPAMAERRFDVTDDTIHISDRIDGIEFEVITAALLFHPDCKVSVTGASATITRNGWSLHIEATAPLTAEPAVWWPDMGVEHPTTRLRLTFPPGCLESALAIRVLPPEKDFQ